MAVIPSNKQNNRVQSGAPIELVNPNDGRRMGEAIAGAGRAVHNFAGQIDEYVQRKNQVDLALYKAELEQRANLKAQEGEVFAKTNPEAPRDGSKAQDDFTQVFGSLREEVQDDDDDKRRAVGLDVVNSVEKQYRNKLVTYQIDRHNSHILEKSNDILNAMSLRVQSSPSEVSKVLQEFDALAKQMPFEGKSGESYMQAGRRSIVTGAIESFAQQGHYQTAKEILNGTSAGSFFSTEERVKLTKDLDARMIRDSNYKWTSEQRALKKLKQEREEMQDKAEAELFTKMVDAASPKEQQEVLELAEEAFKNQLLSRSSYNALLTDQAKVSQTRSRELKSQFMVQSLKGKSLSELKPQILAQMETGELSANDGFGLIRTLGAQAKKESADPEYKQQKALARDYVKAALKPSNMMSTFTIMNGGRENQQAVEIQERMLELESQGKKPMDAARLAVAETIGLHSFASSPDPEINKLNDDPLALQNYGVQVAKKIRELRAQGKYDKNVQKKMDRTLSEIAARIEALKQKRLYEELTRMDAKKAAK